MVYYIKKGKRGNQGVIQLELIMSFVHKVNQLVGHHWTGCHFPAQPKHLLEYQRDLLTHRLLGGNL